MLFLKNSCPPSPFFPGGKETASDRARPTGPSCLHRGQALSAVLVFPVVEQVDGLGGPLADAQPATLAFPRVDIGPGTEPKPRGGQGVG